jgi:HTH-type transcriptional regulator/antitoxin HipB
MPTVISSIREVAGAVRGRRQLLGWSQTEVAHRAGVSRQWVSEFESGKATAEFGLVIRLLDALGLSLSLHAPDRGGETQPPAVRSVDLDDLLEEYREP